MKTFYSYSLVGIINSGIGYFIIFYLTYIQITAEISNLLGYASGLLISYILNKKFTFKSKKIYGKEFPKFIFIMGISYIINLSVLIICFRFLNINVFASQIIAGLTYLIISYVLLKLFVFNTSKKDFI